MKVLNFDNVEHECPQVSQVRKQVCKLIVELLTDHLLCAGKEKAEP